MYNYRINNLQIFKMQLSGTHVRFEELIDIYVKCNGFWSVI